MMLGNFFSGHGGDITFLVRDDIACVVDSIGSYFVTTWGPGFRIELIVCVSMQA